MISHHSTTRQNKLILIIKSETKLSEMLKRKTAFLTILMLLCCSSVLLSQSHTNASVLSPLPS